MSYVKQFGFAAVAAAALMAFVGAGAAPAETTACKTTETPCSAGNAYGVGTVVEGETAEGEGVKKATLTSGLGNISCDSTIKGEIETATTPSGQASSLTWSNCVSGTVQTVTLGTVTGHHDAEHNASATASGFVTKVVQAGITCYWSTEGLSSATATGGSPPRLDITYNSKTIDTPTHDSSAFCPKEAPFHATYVGSKSGPAYASTGA